MNKFAIHAAPFLREALKKAGRTYQAGVRPRKALLKKLRDKVKEIQVKIKKELQRGKEK